MWRINTLSHLDDSIKKVTEEKEEEANDASAEINLEERAAAATEGGAIEGLENSCEEIVEEAPAHVEEINVSGMAVNPKIGIQDDLDRDPSGEGATNLKSEKNTPTRNKMERKHNRASKVCHSCNKPFNDASNFRRHIKKCPSGLLRGHQVVMELPRRSADGFFHCQYCGKEVKDRSNMKRHIRKSHSTQISQTTTT